MHKHLLSVGLTYPYLISNTCWHCAAQSVSPFSFICNHGLRTGAGQ